MMRAVRPIWAAGVAVMSLALLGGCERDMSDLDDYIDKVNARTGRPIPPLPSIEPYEPVPYEGARYGDPFESTEEEEAVAAKAVEAKKPVTGRQPITGRIKGPLEQFPLDSFRMVGTLRIGGTLFGLLRGAGGLLYRVRPGDYLGRNHGRIKTLETDKIVVDELLPDGLGGWLERSTTLELDQ